jgi:hypothetical protein
MANRRSHGNFELDSSGALINSNDHHLDRRRQAIYRDPDDLVAG